MNSKGPFAGRPVHPLLVAFPIALFVATIGLELAHIGTRDAFYFRAAMIANITGVFAALLAVIPGAVELFSLPNRSRERLVANKHALLMMLTTVLFTVSAVVLYRSWSGRELVNGEYLLDATIPLAFDMIGFVTMAAAGALGYALVHTHHVGEKPAIVRFQAPTRPPALDNLYVQH